MKKAELIVIPAPGVGHLIAAVEIAELLLHRDERLFITVLIMKFPIDLGEKAYLQSLTLEANSNPCLRVIELPEDESNSELLSKYPQTFFFEFFNMQKRHVRDVVSKIISSKSSDQLVSFVLDMFCTGMIDVANEFGIPSYVFSTSSAAFLGLMFHFQALKDVHNQDMSELKNADSSVTTLSLPFFVNQFPTKLFPTEFVNEGPGLTMLFDVIRKLREAKVIMVNKFFELESSAIKSLSDATLPTIYPVGPILNSRVENPNNKHRAIMEWLDDQPRSSVVFLCFGSMGSFDASQVKEIARALEKSGQRFLWSLRRPPPKGKMEFPSEYDSLEGVLPEGFLERTKGTGKVIGWAQQLAVLSHPAVGGFVSHCGWNSTLESVSCGVPVATWPLRADQQMNAFQLIKELEMAAEIRMDFRKNYEDHCVDIVSPEEIENGIRQLMRTDHETEIRNKVKDMKEKCRIAVAEGGSSYTALRRFIRGVINDAIHD